jgi:uncharacterized protein YjiS (DUF1127 family)
MKKGRLSLAEKTPIFLAKRAIKGETYSTGGDPMAYTQTNTNTFHRRAPARTVTGLGGLLGAAVNLVLRWQERAQGRAQIRRLDNRMLKDIGLNRVDALREGDKPFWKR